MKRWFFLFGLMIFFIACKNDNKEQKTVTNNAATVAKEETSKKEVANAKKNDAVAIMAKKQVPVLCYHRLENGRNDDYNVSPAQFDAQMKILADSGYKTVSADQLYNYLAYNQPLPEKPIVISFDDTRLEHFTVADPILKKYGFKGLYFIMTISIGKKNYMSKEQIAELAKAGNDIGSHTWDHHMVTKYTPEDWEKQIVGSNKTIQDITGKPVEYFAYPFGINDHTAATELAKHYKLSFILSTNRDATVPTQMVRRMIVAHNWSPAGMLKVIHSTFSRG